MDCDFVETEFYYHHLRSKGESPNEDIDLSWLVYPELSDLDAKEQVGNTTKATNNIIQFNFNNIVLDSTVSGSPVQKGIEE